MSDSKDRRHLKNNAIAKSCAEDNGQQVPNSKAYFWGLPTNFFWDSVGVYTLGSFPKTERRKCKQEKSPEEIVATFTKVLAFVGILGTIVGVLTLLAISGQLQVMQADQRPWIFISTTDITSSFVVAQDGSGHIDIGVHIENSGHTPALHVIMHPVFFTRDDMQIQSMQKIIDICSADEFAFVGPFIEGKSLFPGQKDTLAASLSLDKTSLLQAYKPLFAAMIAGCVDYTFATDNRFHRTYFVYELDKIGDSNRFLKLSPNDRDVPANQLALAMHPILEASPN